ncbi:dethiobiotin synthase [Calycomorphotria hydatis]|uniref:ATP-dependent dethiobiotin synthetase BioD n=1 Tax=Calycomorphotria hydatis TaxID=2528027 RepID=A0A517T3B5_9PLAN|nr:dethiobiotin synthase [Calycomorphotria hydatis]QDT62877.1 ATP-dependent dethiobiotin synthetase BioD 1 [Calycomorphotria hydatis]
MSSSLLSIPGLFVVGTDTDVGKTYVTSRIVRQLRREGVRVGAYKPACSGSTTAEDGSPAWHDIEQLHAALDGEFDRELICPQRFHAPLAPPVAAQAEGRKVDRHLLRTATARWKDHCDFLLIEGVGGLLCPVSEDDTIADLAVDFGCPLLIVARAGLGTINHTLLTIEVARSRGLVVAGVLLSDGAAGGSDESRQSNVEEISKRTDVAVLGVIPYAPEEPLLITSEGDTINWLKHIPSSSINTG